MGESLQSQKIKEKNDEANFKLKVRKTKNHKINKIYHFHW